MCIAASSQNGPNMIKCVPASWQNGPNMIKIDKLININVHILRSFDDNRQSHVWEGGGSRLKRSGSIGDDHA